MFKSIMTVPRLKIEREELATKTIEMCVEGAKNEDIAQALGVTARSVGTFRHKHRLLIERLQSEMIENDLFLATQARHDLVRKYANPKTRKKLDNIEKNHAHQHILKVHESAGLYPGKQAGLSINFEDNSQSINFDQVPSDRLFKEVMRLVEKL